MYVKCLCFFHYLLIYFFTYFAFTKEIKIRDSTGKREILAIKVLTHAIKYFRKSMLNTINRKRLAVKETNIRWVLTVPAIWPDPAKQLMIEAAELVSIFSWFIDNETKLI